MDCTNSLDISISPNKNTNQPFEKWNFASGIARSKGPGGCMAADKYSLIFL
jgi:hypothetical protein